jgi:hypothetical protein
MNNQNITVFSVELGFTALPHLPGYSGALRPGKRLRIKPI